MFPTLLLTWILYGTVTTVQCTGTACRPAPGSPPRIGPHRLAVFATAEECALYRTAMGQRALPVVHPAARTDITIRKQITYTCAPGRQP